MTHLNNKSRKYSGISCRGISAADSDYAKDGNFDIAKERSSFRIHSATLCPMTAINMIVQMDGDRLLWPKLRQTKKLINCQQLGQSSL